MLFLFKTCVSAVIIVAASELAKRSSLLGAMLISIPLTSILAFCWLYYDTKDAGKVAALSWDVLCLIAPSSLFFVSLPLLLQHNYSFALSVAISIAIMLVGYALTVWLRNFV